MARCVLLCALVLALGGCGCEDDDFPSAIPAEVDDPGADDLPDHLQARCAFGYLVQGASGDFYRVDLESGEALAMPDNFDGQINAIGYNPLDHKIYGLARELDGNDRTTLSLVVVTFVDGGLDVQVVEVPVPAAIQPLIPRAMYLGEILPSGQLVMSEGNASGFATVDVNPDSPTYLDHVAYTPYTGDGRPGFPGDWSYSAIDGYLYTIDRTANASRDLWRVDPATGITERLGPTGIPEAHRSLGACYMTAAGISYWGDNKSGTLYRIDLSDLSMGVPQAQPATTGPGNVSWNDGARCYLVE